MVAKPKKTKEKILKDDYTGPRNILITGAAGYVGAMLCDQFSICSELKNIIAIDKEPMPELLKGNKKIKWITSELSSGEWEKEAEKFSPEVIMHTAWQISELLGESDKQRKMNIEGSERIFNFFFKNTFTKKLIHFSTISSYGAFDTNSPERLFVEGDMLRENEYLYGLEKKEVESILAKKYSESSRNKDVFVLRPTTIMGPRCKYMSGKKGLLYTIEHEISFFPMTNEKWGRQYVHEDDITDIVAIMTFNEIPVKGYEVFNVSPKDILFGEDLVKFFGKEKKYIPPFFVRVAFFFARNFFVGRFPATGVGSWKFLCYPIFIEGSKVNKVLKYKYNFSSFDALEAKRGRYEYIVPRLDDNDKQNEVQEKDEQ